MSGKNPESRLWQKVKEGLNQMFLTRIESSSINGIPDVHGVHKQGVFWIELKSDKSNYPKLNRWQIVWINRYVKAGGTVFLLHENLGKTLSERRLKLYRPVSLFTDPRSLVPRFSFSFPYQWPTVQQRILQELVQRDPEQQVA
jgi:Holliday junction resolvase